MKTVSINLYEFKELSKETQQKVLNQNRYINTENYDWYDLTIQEQAQQLSAEGYHDAKVYFSGFGSQGDDACFDADIDTSKMLELFPEFNELKSEIESGNLSFEIKKNGYSNQYSHENTRYVDLNFEINNRPIELSRLEVMAEQMADKINAHRKQLCNKIYRELEVEHDYLISDQAIIETFESNEYTFEENGKIRRA